MKNRLGFTLVELIVVVTILAILGTIGFVSYSSYLTGVRDANRTSSLEAISSGLSLYTTSAKSLPIPDQAVEIHSGSVSGANLIAYQGQAGVTVLETIDYSKAGQDPADNEPYRYLIDRARKYHQMVAYAEESDTSLAYELLFPQANAIDLSLRYPIFYGEKLGVFIEKATDNQPLDAITGGATQLTLAAILSNFNIHFDENTSITTAVTSLAYANTLQVGGLVSSCAVLNAKRSLTSTGTYLTSSGGVTEASCGEDSI